MLTHLLVICSIRIRVTYLQRVLFKISLLKEERRQYANYVYASLSCQIISTKELKQNWHEGFDIIKLWQ